MAWTVRKPCLEVMSKKIAISSQLNHFRKDKLCNIHSSQIVRHKCTHTINVDELLSDFNKQQCVERLQKLSVPNVTSKQPKIKAAVLVPLCIVDSQLSLLYTLRKSNLRKHRGQVSFPGGVQDKCDNHLIATALREAEEELNIPPNLVDVWGCGKPIIGTEFSVLPVLGFIGDVNKLDIKPNPSEVELMFTLSLLHFCDSANCRYTRFRFKNMGTYVMPVYLNRTCRIWGMTAAITHIMLSALLPDKYNLQLTKNTGY
ncbi:nucleoside diphosphate-linked moiety X motif 8 [Nilaparvata lugens]|uniref:nucleoside diphosphate-linked moiety X motif 8 n=1 Tax=Nilaparvata lugens TaxID=108931 RepID=UPI00193CC587|nr:nucleoside diphosphate-linked moiety X motif 8 [Nilaparvata lugens]